MENHNISVAIIDDDKDFAEILSHFLKKIGIHKIRFASTVKEGKKLISSENFNLVLLDIDFGGDENGFDLGNYIQINYPEIRIVFFTNNFSDDFYESAKALKPNAFLDKELSELKVRQTIELIFLHDKDLKAIPLNTSHFENDFVFIKVGNAFKKILFSEVDYIVYADRYANFVVEGKFFPLNMTMKDLAKNLPESKFIQIHQSYIANLDKINQVTISENQLEVNGKILPIGVSFKKAIQTRLRFLT